MPLAGRAVERFHFLQTVLLMTYDESDPGRMT